MKYKKYMIHLALHTIPYIHKTGGTLTNAFTIYSTLSFSVITEYIDLPYVVWFDMFLPQNHNFLGLKTQFLFMFFSDDAASDFSSKSGTPSPILGGPRLPHGVVATRDLVRDFRESSVASRSSHGDHEESPFREESIPRDYENQANQRHPSPFNRASKSSLGVSFSNETFIFFSDLCVKSSLLDFWY